jgi:hypothetical protein
MAQKLEEMMNEFRYPSAITTDKNITAGGTLTVTGAVTLSSTLASGALTVTGAASATGVVIAKNATTDTAGGVVAFQAGNGLWGIYYGSGAPTASAPLGSLYMRTNGTNTSNRLYVNTNGGTSWAGVVTDA